VEQGCGRVRKTWSQLAHRQSWSNGSAGNFSRFRSDSNGFHRAVHGAICFGGEESAGASFLCRDGTVWTTDKDGIILSLLAAEIIATTGAIRVAGMKN